MPLLDSVPVTSCHECVAMLTLPLALFLLLAETAVGGFGTVAYLRLTGGTDHRLLSTTHSASGPLIFLQGLLVAALVVHAVIIWRRDASRLSWVLTLGA